jgi:hypothetical protein
MQLTSLFHRVAPDGLAVMHASLHASVVQLATHERMAVQGVLAKHAIASEQQHCAIHSPQTLVVLTEHPG